ncbi:MAG: peptidylprolyl isomerase [Roseibium sp.]
MSIFSRFIRQPLVHFLIIGAAIFALYSLVPQEDVEVETSGTSYQPSSEIIVSPERVASLETEFRAVWQRDATEDERQNLIENYIREEVLVREALKLELNRDDTVIRRRLVQKMDFLASSAARSITPDVDELKAYYEDTKDVYMRPGRIAFSQIYLGETLDEAAVEDVKTRLAAGEAPDNLGQKSMLATVVKLSVLQRVDGLFGIGFFEQLMALDGDGWQGPVRSGFGYHLIRVDERQNSEERPWDSIRAHVVDNFVLKKADELKQMQFEGLKGQYEIVLTEPAQ